MKVNDFEIINKKIKCNICEKKSEMCYKDTVYCGAYAISREMCEKCAKERGHKIEAQKTTPSKKKAKLNSGLKKDRNP